MTSQKNSLLKTAQNEISQKRWNKVEEIANDIINLDAEDIDGHYLLGKAKQSLGLHKSATEHLTRALKICPHRYDIAIDLADSLSLIKQNRKALELITKYDSQIQNSPRQLTIAGNCLIRISLAEQSVAPFKQALKLQPEIRLFKANLATSLVYIGELEQAKKLYQELLIADPHHQNNHYQFSRLNKAIDESHISAMLKSLATTKMPPHKNIFMYFALGKEYEDIGNWDEAFKYYKLAGDTITQTSNHQPEEDIRLINAIIKTFDRRWFESTPEASLTLCKTPIFILGLPRTGSTLLERLLSSHSNISTIGETLFLPDSVRTDANQAQQQPLTESEIINAALGNPSSIANAYLERIDYLLDEAEYFIEKLPYNSLLIGIIRKSFPNAKVIVLDRDPMDTCFSMYKQVFTWAYRFSYNLDHLGNYFVHHQKMMEHWRTFLSDYILTVSYEKLITNTAYEMEKILQFIGLPLEPNCLQTESNIAASTTASSIQVRDKININSVQKWKHFQKHLIPLQQIIGTTDVKEKQ